MSAVGLLVAGVCRSGPWGHLLLVTGAVQLSLAKGSLCLEGSIHYASAMAPQSCCCNTERVARRRAMCCLRVGLMAKKEGLDYGPSAMLWLAFWKASYDYVPAKNGPEDIQ